MGIGNGERILNDLESKPIFFFELGLKTFLNEKTSCITVGTKVVIVCYFQAAPPPSNNDLGPMRRIIHVPVPY